MTMTRWFAIAALGAATACSSSSTGYGGNPPPPPPPASGGHLTTITVSNNQFTPTPDTIHAGTITFHWAANAIIHNVTWISGPLPLPRSSVDKMGGDADYQVVLQAGQYDYYCTHHSLMTGRIVVLP